MLDIFIPDYYYQSIFKINYAKLKKNGIKCLLYDLDNTIAPYSMHEPDKRLKDLFSLLEHKYGFKVIIMSNSGKRRLTPFKEQLNVDTSCNSKKPLRGKYKKIMKLYKFKPHEMAMIGDQLMTDVFGANRMGINSIFVNPISKIEHLPTHVNRYFESKIIKRLNKRGILIKGEYYE